MITDPLEQMVENALVEARIEYRHQLEGGTKNLDFYLPQQDVYLEIKGGHTERIAEQMGRDFNVIAIQGVKSVALFCKLLKP